MSKQKIVLFLVLFFVCLHLSLLSQSADKISGCAPLQVNFTAPAGSTSWNWNFGNGTSTLPNPSNVYNNPGSYQVTYSGTGGTTTGTLTITVTANNINPSLTFILPQTKCTPMPVSFNGTNSGGGTNYQWAFGDGVVLNGTAASPTHIYTIQGVFNTTLAITNPATNCTGTVTAGPIDVSIPANLVISANPGFNSCQAPFSTAFTSTNSTTGSPLGGSLTCSWDFGNTQTSTQPTPGTITYNNQGLFNVTLTTTDNNSCSTTSVIAVSVIQPTLSVTVPSSVCIAGQELVPPPFFYCSAQSSGASSVWNMGDGNTVTLQTAAGTFSYPLYTVPGLKTLTITTSVGTCSATLMKTVFVESITAQFVAPAPNYTCSPVLYANYVSTSSVNCGDPLTYSWRASAWDQLPSDIYTLGNVTNATFTLVQSTHNPYAFYGLYPSTTTLQVSSGLGCVTQTASLLDSIRRPTAWFNTNKDQGCRPLTVNFRDSSNTWKGVYPILSYTWNNGANPAIQATGAGTPSPIAFTYTAVGTYTPFLIIKTSGGCLDTSFIDTLKVVNQPTVSVSIPNVSVCAGQPFQINMSALPSNTVIQNWNATSDDGFFSDCLSNPNPVWVSNHLGVRSFTVSASDHGCTSTVAATQSVTVKGPVASCRFRTNCIKKKEVDFISYLQSAQSATLDFGDGNSMLLVGNATGTISNITTHTYNATGDYTATLKGSNLTTGCGPFVDSMWVHVKDAVPSFTVPSLTCSGSPVLFNASASTDVFVSCNRGYTWLIDNLLAKQSASPAYNPIIPLEGIHTVTLIVKDINTCLSSQTQTFFIDNPTPSFSVNANPICSISLPVQITNNTPDPLGTTQFTWSFGISPSSTLVTAAVGTFTYSYPPVIPSQTYTIRLTAYSNGCIGDSSIVLQVIKPPDNYIYPFLSNLNGGCINVPINFLIDPPPPPTQTVNFQDNSPLIVANTAIVSHVFTAPGIYTVTTTESYMGCDNIGTAPISIQDFPQADFIIYPTGSVTNTSGSYCAPASISFSSTSTSNYPITKYGWDLGTNSNIVSNQVVGTLYTAPGQETVSLVVYTSNGCSSSIVHTLSILGPTATAVVDRASFCEGQTIQLSIKDSSEVLGWDWFFGDGSSTGTVLANSAPTETISYPYNTYPQPNGSTVINLVYFSSGYLCPTTATIGILVNKIHSKFNRNAEAAAVDSMHCLGIPDQFNNISTKNNNTQISALDFSWGFGNGDISTTLSPGYTYTVPGVYMVTLTVVDPLLGCKDVSVKSMTINPLPSGRISLPDSICQASTFILNSTSSSDASTFQWQPVAGVASPNSPTTTATASISTTYSMTIGNRFGCTVVTNNEYVYIQPPAPKVRFDTTLIIGQTATLNSNFGTNFTYTWSPVADLSCIYCPNPITTSTANITYSVSVEDKMGCFTSINTYSVIVDPETSVDVPTAFTPNGDGVNDVIYVSGWGIKKLNYFRIFNRWGELLFESTDIKVGWDGSFKGVPQNMETYVYQASVDGYISGVTMNKTSSFRLVR